MWAIIFSKVSATILGIVWLGVAMSPPLPWRIGILTILPIWFEVVVTLAFRVEPGMEQRRLWKFADAVADSISFILAPVFVFVWLLPSSTPTWFFVFPVLFLACAFYRIGRFLKRGLVDGKFEGLPVTYTGYWWPIALWLVDLGYSSLSAFGFSLLAFLMVWRKIKIRSV